MKRLLLIIALCALALGACGKSKKDEIVETSGETTVQMTFEEYCEINTTMQNYLTSIADLYGYTITVDENTVIFEYTLDYEITAEEFKAYAEEINLEDTLNEVAEGISESSDFDISVLIKYLSEDGELLYSQRIG